VKVTVIYESLTGNTRTAAGLIAEEMARKGLDITAVSPVTAVDLKGLAAADLVVVGTWTDGIFVVGQRPGRIDRLTHMPAMAGKRAVVYCTYALNPGKTIDKLMRVVEGRGADVMGGLALSRRHLADGALDFVDRLTVALAL
jgi:flavorubredoxin